MAHIPEHHPNEKPKRHQIQRGWVELFVAGDAVGVDYLLGDLHHLAVGEEGGWGAGGLFRGEDEGGQVGFLCAEGFELVQHGAGDEGVE